MNSAQKLTTQEAAAYLRLQPGTLEVWRCRGRGPKYHKIGRRVIYDLEAIEEFARAHTVLTVDTCPVSANFARALPISGARCGNEENSK